jgi:hypothetical protein
MPQDVLSGTLDEHNLLRKYTGWFASDNGARVVITLDYIQLRVGVLAPNNEGGAIETSYDLSLLDDKIADDITSSVGQPTVTFAKLKDTAMVEPANDMVMFSIENNEVTGVGFNGVAYKSTICGECEFFTLPVELREKVWKLALATELGYVHLCKTWDENKSTIISSDIKVRSHHYQC